MLQAALKAQRLGFHIFPVKPGDKVPHRLAGAWGETATNDINQIVHFWTQVDPTANIGVACKPSGLLVVDLDIAKEDNNLRGTRFEWLHEGYGPRVDGESVLDEMRYQAKGDSSDFDTYTVRTGSGGMHLYYRWPADWPKMSQASPVKGAVDVRGNGGQHGGYVLAEGSRTAAGEYVQRDNYPIPLPPVWVRMMVIEKPKQPAPSRPMGPRQPSAVSWSGLVDSVRNAGEGNRNNALVWASRTMCSEGASENECLSTLGPAAQDAGLPRYEIERTVASAYRTQRQKEGI